jgi:glyoxylase-like metal-dependent hydrolase (beta-lactamase superfamily II)
VAVVVHHPRGPLLVDAGMGREGVAHLATTPRLMQAIVELDVARGTADALRQGGVAPSDLVGVLLTHSHWDHVSGLQDLPDLPVWMTPEEQVHAVDDPGALLYRQLDAARPIDVHTLELTGGSYGPFARSLDLFGDGSVVVVPMPGHTPGSVGVLVNLPSGRRFLFIGDTAWAREGVDWPAEKPWVSRRMVDGDPASVREQLVQLHQLQRAHPELVVVPAHDARVHATMATLPERER